MTHHTTESVERLAVELSTPIDPGLGFKIELHENTVAAKTLRDLAAERDAMRARLDEAAQITADVMNDLLGEARGIVPESADAFYDGRAGEFSEDRIARAFLNGGGNG